MDLNFELLAARLKGQLPGPLAHEPLRATPLGVIKPKFDHVTPPKPGSVIILLYEREGQYYFPLTKRPEYLGTHGGQISLPGGKAEPGESPIDTALREAEEEIGVPGPEIDVVGTLSDFFVIPSNFVVTPVIGKLKIPPVFLPDPKEVVKVLEGSVAELIREDAVQVREIVAARMFPMLAPHFQIENEIVWGATAMMLNEFRLVLREILK